MIRKFLKKRIRNKKIHEFLIKYKISPEYFFINRKMVSRAVLLGIFIALIPMPMQMAVVLLFTPFMKFNVPTAIVMCWISNPFTMPPLYYVEYLTGSFILGTEIEDLHMSVHWFKTNIDNIFIPLYLGAFIFSFIFSIAGYWTVNSLWIYSVNKSKKIHRHKR